MYPQYWTPSIGGTYQNRKAEAAAQKYGAAASAFYLAAAQPVECSHDNAELCRVALDRCEELFQFLCLIDLRLELFLTRTFNAVCGVGTDHADLKSTL